MNGIIYEHYAGTDVTSAVRLGQADSSDCDDAGRNATGSYFPQDSQQVTVWALPGLNPTTGIGVHLAEDTYIVYFARETPPEEKQKIFNLLRHSSPSR
jgi:hypothetical protein